MIAYLILTKQYQCSLSLGKMQNQLKKKSTSRCAEVEFCIIKENYILPFLCKVKLKVQANCAK